MTILRRKPAKHMSIRLRHLSLTSNEQVTLRLINRRMRIAIAASFTAETKEDEEESDEIFDYLAFSYVRIVYCDTDILAKPMRYDVKIDIISDSWCKMFLRFRKPGLKRLFVLLKK
jgi:hypothetical protein